MLQDTWLLNTGTADNCDCGTLSQTAEGGCTWSGILQRGRNVTQRRVRLQYVVEVTG